MDKTGKDSDLETLRDTPQQPAILRDLRGPLGYRMIESAEVRNFRGFDHVEIHDIRRFNIIVGDNGAGKTALMEALFLAIASSPQHALYLRAWRGLPTGGFVYGQRAVYAALWGDLFHRYDLGKLISINVDGSDGDTRSLKLFASEQPTVLPLEEVSAKAPPGSPVTFEWRTPVGAPAISTPLVTPQGLVIPPLPDSPIKGAFIAARNPFNIQENATYFSALNKKGEGRPFIRQMKTQFTEIEDISVEVDFGLPLLFVKQKGRGPRMPIGVLSDGMNKISAILLNLAFHDHGALFVDEIDTGIYFKRHMEFWNQIGTFGEQYKTQLFATTHSLEFLRAASPLMKRAPENFSLMRVYKDKMERSRVSIVTGQRAITLIKSGLEVRT